MYSFRTTLTGAGPAIDLAFTDRHGDSEHLDAVLSDFAPGEPLRQVHQVHGSVVDVVEERSAVAASSQADAILTSTPGTLVGVRSADCVPVLLVDETNAMVAAVHSGRPGLAARVVPATVERMRERGAGDLEAWIGPHVCGHCYEVPDALCDQVAAIEPTSRATTSWGTPALDLGAGVRAQLERLGVTVHDVSVCTRESAELHSYRRDGERAGRQWALVRVRP